MGGKYRFSDFAPDERRLMVEECGLTEDEAAVFDARARTDSVTAAALRLHTSDSTRATARSRDGARALRARLRAGGIGAACVRRAARNG